MAEVIEVRACIDLINAQIAKLDSHLEARAVYPLSESRQYAELRAAMQSAVLALTAGCEGVEDGNFDPDLSGGASAG